MTLAVSFEKMVKASLFLTKNLNDKSDQKLSLKFHLRIIFIQVISKFGGSETLLLDTIFIIYFGKFNNDHFKTFINKHTVFNFKCL